MRKYICILLLFFGVLILPACTREKNSAEKDNFINGQKIYEIAKEFSTKFPFRDLDSSELNLAKDYIKEFLEQAGYTLEEQKVSSNSYNIIANLKGRGFSRTEEEAKDIRGEIDTSLFIGKFNKRVIFLASYDTKLNSTDKTSYPNHTGFSDNASGVAQLLQLAFDLTKVELGYDISFVFTVGKYNEQLGSRTFLSHLSEDELAEISVVIDLHKLFSGNKLYAHAGRSALKPKQKYAMREPLYLLIDLFSLENIYRNYEVNLLTTQNNFKVKLNNFNEKYLYREFSMNDSDYLAFDEKNIPIIYIDSGEYNINENDNYKENTARSFSKNNYLVSATNLDNHKTLEIEIGKENLIRRGEALSHLLTSFLKTGLINAKINK